MGQALDALDCLGVQYPSIVKKSKNTCLFNHSFDCSTDVERVRAHGIKILSIIWSPHDYWNMPNKYSSEKCNSLNNRGTLYPWQIKIWFCFWKSDSTFKIVPNNNQPGISKGNDDKGKMARSSFRWFTMWHFARAYLFYCSTDFNRQNFDRWVCVFIGDETVTTDGNPMPLVHSILYRPCTACIGCASIVTVLSPIKTQDYTHVFFSVAVQFVLQPTWNLVKNR